MKISTQEYLATAPAYKPKPNYSNSLAAIAAIQAVGSAFSSYQQGKAQKAIYKANESISRMQAEDAIKRGHELEARSRQRTRKLRGSQRTALAAQGIRLDAGSALDIQMETEDFGELDALTIKNNALREAFGYRSQARVSSMQGQLADSAAKNEAIQTLLTGGMKAAKQYKEGKP